MLANVNEQLYHWTIQVMQGIVAAGLRWGGSFISAFWQFISECKSERVIKIGPRLPKLPQKYCVDFLTHSIVAVLSR